MSLLIKALEQAAKDRTAGRVEPHAETSQAGLSAEPTLEPPPAPRAPRTRLEDTAAPSANTSAAPAAATAKPLSRTPPPPSTGANPLALDQATAKTQARSLAGLANIDAQQRARAAAVVQAAGGPAANAIGFLRANPVMFIGAVAVLFGVGFGVYVYLQVAHPGFFVRTSTPAPQPPAQTQAPAPASANASTPGTASTPPAPTVTMVPQELPVSNSDARPAEPQAPSESSRGTQRAIPASSVVAPAAPADTPRAVPDRPLPTEQRRDRGTLHAEAPQPASVPASSASGPSPTSGAAAASTAPADASSASRERIAVSTTNAQPRLNPMLTQAYTLLQAGKWEEAQASYTKLLQSEPLNIDALLGLAYIAAQQNRSDEATRHYLRILELNPRHTLAQAALIALIGRADPAASESRLKQLISREPSAFLHFVLGNLYAEQSQWSQAQQSFFQAHHLDPGNPDYAYNLAVGLDHLRQTKSALDYYRRAEQLASTQGRSNFDVNYARERIRVLSSGLE